MAELAEGARLLSELGGKPPTRVRIPLSPPFQQVKQLISPWDAFLILKSEIRIPITVFYPLLITCLITCYLSLSFTINDLGVLMDENF